ncbi:hypothetical protein FQA47_002763 [Oryzias melastigma]|uniref:Uncharacterized protein n=1 Tax=Oryzias melastigma TaxID=30732 RepID=A0A834F3R2_ORYME|nr:hypothetical protein FQA47_002763 [Oryzias melastigma]
MSRILVPTPKQPPEAGEHNSPAYTGQPRIPAGQSGPPRSSRSPSSVRGVPDKKLRNATGDQQEENDADSF